MDVWQQIHTITYMTVRKFTADQYLNTTWTAKNDNKQHNSLLISIILWSAMLFYIAALKE